MARRTNDDDPPFDEDGVLKDGRTVRVSLMDALSVRGPARPLLHDGLGHAAGHRSGFVFTRDEYARDSVIAAYADYEESACRAWRDGKSEFVGAREGDLCTIDGAPGHLNGDLVCVPDASNRNATRADHAAIMDKVYAEYDGREEWRGTDGTK